MRIRVILNPYANRWRAARRKGRLEAALHAASLDYSLFLTKGSGDARAEARRAAESGEWSAVVAAGGDGTVSEVVSGLVAATDGQATIPLGILPIGTGNDFADMTGVPRDLDAAARVIAGGRTRLCDLARANKVVFDNNCGVGMEPLVTIENAKIRHVSGNLRYLLAVGRALRALRAWRMRVDWGWGRYDGPVFLVSVCNTPRTGGLFRMAPQARPDDGVLDIVLVPEISKQRVLALLPRILCGKHVNDPAVRYMRAHSVRIESDPGTPIHADGEVLGADWRTIEIETLPGRLSLLVPDNLGSQLPGWSGSP